MKLIAAVSQNNVIGSSNNSLPWVGSYPEDMKFFRKMTTDSTIVMGRNTFESIGRPLPKRRNIVLTSRITPKIPGVESFQTLEQIVKAIKSDENVWVIGGAQVYKLFLDANLITELFITKIPETITGGNLVYMPDNIYHGGWELQETIELAKPNLNCYHYTL